MIRCFNTYTDLLKTYENVSQYGSCDLTKTFNNNEPTVNLKQSSQYIARIVNIDNMYSSNDEDVASIILTVLDNAHPVNGSLLQSFLSFVGIKNLSTSLKHKYFTGKTFASKQNVSWHQGKIKWIVIGVGGNLCFFL